MPNFSIFLLLFYLFTESIGGLIRWLAESNDIGLLVYAPKLILIVGIILFLLLKRQSMQKWMVLLIFCIYILIGVFSNGTLQSLFGVFVLAPFFYSLLLVSIPQEYSSGFLLLIIFMFLITVSGIFYDRFYGFEWVGTTSQTVFGEMEVAREWWTQGIKRSSGFTRLSHTAGLITAILVIFIGASNLGWKKKVLFFALGFYAILLTTSKTIFLALLVTIPFLSINIAKRFRYIAVWSIVFIQSILLISPLFPFIVDFIKPTDMQQIILMGSFYARLSETWPQFISSIMENSVFGLFTVILGGGIGSSGAAQKLISGQQVLSDNALLYLWGTVGVFGFYFYYLLISSTINCLSRTSNVARAIGLCGLIIMFLGITTDIFESSFSLVILGLLLNIGISLNSTKKIL